MNFQGKLETEQQPQASTSSSELPAALNFFKYAQGGSDVKRKTTGDDAGRSGKKRKLDEEPDEEDDPKSDTEGDNSIPRQRHRVTTKGSNIPEYAETFEDLRDRYQLSSLLLSNLSNNGYSHPTGIQSYGIPILLEVLVLARIT